MLEKSYIDSSNKYMKKKMGHIENFPFRKYLNRIIEYYDDYLAKISF